MVQAKFLIIGYPVGSNFLIRNRRVEAAGSDLLADVSFQNILPTVAEILAMPLRKTQSGDRTSSVLAVCERDTFTLREDISLQRAKLRVVGSESRAFDRIFDTPIDHVVQQGEALKLDLVFRIGDPTDCRWYPLGRSWRT